MKNSTKKKVIKGLLIAGAVIGAVCLCAWVISAVKDISFLEVFKPAVEQAPEVEAGAEALIGF